MKPWELRMSSPTVHYNLALEASKKIHEGKQFTGKFLRPHAIFIKEIIDRLEVKSILDFGCGKGQQYEWIIPATNQTIEDFWGVKVTRYDPAYPPFAAEPEGTFDLVICTQVLGAIPITDHPWVIDRLYAFANKALYVSERLGDARKIVGNPNLRAFDYTPQQWLTALTRSKPIEVTVAFRNINPDGQKITKHHRCIGGDLNWRPVKWPDDVRAMNHKWRP